LTHLSVMNRVVVSVSTSRSRDGLETYQRLVSVSSRSRLEKNCQRLGLVSANYVSCPRPIFGQIVQATLMNGLWTPGVLKPSLSLTKYLSKSCYYHIRELRCLRPYLDFKTASTIATSIVHSKLDYYNSMYYILPHLR